MGLFSSVGNAVKGAVKGVAKSFGGSAGFSAGGAGEGAGGGAAGGAATGNPWLAAGGLALDYFGQQQANAQNMDIANKQMHFQRRMSNSSYQRATKDMIAAGLNPMLAYSQGGASTPSGATTRMESTTTKGIQSALNAIQTNSAVDLQRSQTAQSGTQASLNSAQTAKVNAETANEMLRSPNIKAELPKLNAEIANIGAQTKLHSASEAQTRQVTGISAPAATGAKGFMDLFQHLQNSALSASRAFPAFSPTGFLKGSAASSHESYKRRYGSGNPWSGYRD